MGMDIYFQAHNAKNVALTERVNIRNREVYHYFNDQINALKGETPENGEIVKIPVEIWTSTEFLEGLRKAFKEGWSAPDLSLDELDECVSEVFNQINSGGINNIAYVTYQFTN